MTKKHFIAIAAAIKAALATTNDTAVVRTIAADLATTFKTINPAFDRQRFMTACGF